MESYLRSMCEELWDIVEQGYLPEDPSSLSPHERVLRQLNSTARDKISVALPKGLYNQVHRIESAKDLWDRIIILQEGTSLTQKTNYECAKREMDLFVIMDGENLKDAYSRLDVLRVRIQGLGCEKYNDGFDVNDEFIKNKIIQIVAPDDKQMALIMQFLDTKKDMSPDDLVSFFTANQSMVEQGNRTKQLVRAMNSPNLALKAKGIRLFEEEQDEEYDERVEMTSTSELDVDQIGRASCRERVLRLV